LITIGRNDGRLFFPISRSIIEHINEEASTIDAIAGVAFSRQTLEHESESEDIATEVVTDGFFEAVGPRLQIGRGFTTADHRAETEPVAVLSYALWQRDYGGRTEALGSTIRIRGRNPFSFGGDQPEVSQAHRIVGVPSYWKSV
jgi:hypothetical protein